MAVVDTPGFGFSVNNNNCWQPISDYIENRYEEYLNAETRLHRKNISGWNLLFISLKKNDINLLYYF